MAMPSMFENINLPIFLILTLFLSYILYLRYIKDEQKEDGISIKSIKDILIILNLCLFLLIFFFFLSLILSVIVLGGVTNIPFITNLGKDFLIPFLCFWIIIFLCSYNGKNASECFFEILITLMRFYFFSLLILLLLIFLPYIGILSHLAYYRQNIIFFEIILFLSSFISYQITKNIYLECNKDVPKLFFKKDHFKKLNDFLSSFVKRISPILKNAIVNNLLNLFMGLLIVCLFIFVTLILFPSPTEKQSHINYHILATEYAPRTYLKTNINLTLPWYVKYPLAIHTIAIDYGKYGVDTSIDGSEHFKLTLISTKTNLVYTLNNFEEIKKQSSEGNLNFSKLYLDQDKKIIFLYLDNFYISSDQIYTIILEGYIKENFSENYTYKSNRYNSSICSSIGCIFQFNFNNKFNETVFDDRDYFSFLILGDYPIDNTSKCRFTEYNFSVGNQSYTNNRNDCSDNTCCINLLFDNSSSNFDQCLRISDSSIFVDKITIPKNLSIQTIFTLSC